MHSSPILVIGSTGKTGKRIVEQLRSGGHTVREGSRNSEIPFDWGKAETWPDALAGVKAVYISYYPDLAMDEAPAAIEVLTKLAKTAGVEHLVLLSGRGESNAQLCEKIVRGSGLDYTLVRASWFFQNFTEGHLLDPVLEGVIAMPAADIREPFIDTDDIADVAVAALTDPRHKGELYEVTGPQLLSFAQVASEISKTAAREVHYAPISLDEFHAGLSESAGKELADLFTNICEEVFDGRNAKLGDGVQKALGREPRSFAAFCHQAGQTGIWNTRNRVTAREWA